jgi:hypothetical protein
MIRSDQLSPKISSAMLIGQPDRRPDRGLAFMMTTLSDSLQIASQSCYHLQSAS